MEATSGIQDGVVSLPSGGGALTSLGERFQPDLVRGTGNYSIPLVLPQGPMEIKPDLSLRYSTGQGNGTFGMGWQLVGPLTICRRTDRGVPYYDDDVDEFVLSGAETLVHVGGGRYRPRTDTQGWLIRRVDDGWTVRTKDGRRYVLGATPAGRIMGVGGIFMWLVEEEQDRAGNRIEYRWEIENGYPYLAEITWSIFAVRFVYEERPDRVHSARAGFDREAGRRCVRIEKVTTTEAQPITGRYLFAYEQAAGSGVSLLCEVCLEGVAADASVERYPPVRMTYTPFELKRQPLRRLEAAGSYPPSLDGAGAALIDMNGDGLPDLLETGTGAHRWWPNCGDGRIGPVRTLTAVPAGMTIGDPGVSFADLDGNGTADLFRTDRRLTMAVANTGHGAWAERLRVYRHQPPLDLSATDTRLIDLDGDGVPDLLQSSRYGFLISYNRGAAGWSTPQVVSSRSDPDAAPVLDLDAKETHIADMSGDGLTDLCFVASGRVEYWPSLGRGRFGPRIAMQHAPRFPAHFDPERLYLVDLDGDGAADLLYVDHDRLLFWINRSGAAWSERFEVPFIPPPGDACVTLVDLFGEGTAGLLWSMRPSRGNDTGYRFLSLCGPVKPYLLSTIDDGFGGITEIAYGTSAAERRRDAQDSDEWNTFLPFPLQVITEIAQTDRASGRTTRTRFRYHRGHYDGCERELRGFESVEQELIGDGHTPTVVQEFAFFQGGEAVAGTLSAAERARLRALSGSMIRVCTRELDGAGTRSLRQEATVEWEAREEFCQGDRCVHFPHMAHTTVREIAPGGGVRIETVSYAYDRFGNLTGRVRESRIEGSAESPLRTEQRLTYTRNEAQWLVGLPASITTLGPDGDVLGHELHYYDGDPFTGLPLGQAERGLLRRTRDLVHVGALLPEGYAAEIDPAWGLTTVGSDWYRDKAAYDHDERGNVVASRTAFGAIKTVVYDENGLFPLRQVDEGGFVTGCSFDPRTAQPIELKQPGGQVSRFVLSPLGRVRAKFETGPDGAVSLVQAFSIDFGDYAAEPVRPARIVSIRPAAPGRRADEFPDGLDPAAVTDASAACDYYDSEGNLLERLVRSDRAEGQERWIARERRSYTARGRPSVEYPNAWRETPAFALPGDAPGVGFFFDGLNQIVRVERPDGTRLDVRFFGDRIEKRDASTPDEGPPTVERYNACGHLVAVEQPVDGGTTTTRYERDALGRITAIFDASGRRLLTYRYAGPGPALRIEHADAGFRIYWRDAAGSLRRRTDSLGRCMTIRYDDLGRLTSVIDGTNPAQPVTVRSLGYRDTHLTEANEGTVRTTYAYDPAGNTTQTSVHLDGRTLTVSREYAYDGRPTALVYPDGTRLEYERGADSAIARIPGVVDAVDYDEYGSPTAIRFTGGPYTEYSYDPLFHRMERAALRTGRDAIRELEIGYDANGNIASLLDRIPGRTYARRFEHDPAYRLTRAEMLDGATDGPLVRDDRYDYTPTGDMVRNDESLIAPMLYDDPMHAGRLTGFQRRTSPGIVETITYDEAGRATALGGLTDLRYDLFDRLVSAAAPDGASVRFTYDHCGIRVKKEVSGGDQTSATRYVEALYEQSATGTRLNVYLGNLLIAVRQTPAGGSGETHYVLTDHLGSILAACDPAGVERAQQMYSAFGLPLRAPGSHDRFIGLEADGELGLSQFGARFYCPALGRFLTPDWFVAEDPERALRMPQGLNAYSYAVNNPLALRDPSGLWFGIDDLIAAAVGFVVGFVAGIAHGIANGYSFGDTLLNGLEGGLLGAVGGWLAYNTLGLAGAAFAAGGFFGISGGVLLSAAATGIFINSIMSGAMQIYAWDSGAGWAAFLTDYSWGIVGTAMGGMLQFVNLFYGTGANYRQDLSRRQNRHVYDGGFGFGTYAFTQGNVISNLDYNNRGDPNGLLNHEGLHIFQSRLFGPLFQATYISWLVVGGALGIVIFGPIAAIAGESYGDAIFDVAYHDNPWEAWAYTENPAPGGRGGMFSYAP